MNEKKNKIAVITLRGPNRNYGCILQMYALHKQFEKLGYSSEVIDFKLINQPPATVTNADNTTRMQRILAYSPIVIIKKIVKKIITLPTDCLERFVWKKHFLKSRALRHRAVDTFENKYIPKSQDIYTEETAENILPKYDFFVCGSDQVWNPKWYNGFYRMDFIPKSFPKFSYAASISVDRFSSEQEELFKNTLSSYIGVSVREKQAVSLLQPLSPIAPVQSLDPTLLLDKSDWDNIASERLVKKPYMFCYFLDRGEKLRKLAKQYARKHHLRIVYIPYTLNGYHRFDRKYSDQFIESASPTEFISLIKFADVVFTDSYHASVFSSIYEKEFFVFRRHGQPGMSARVETLTQMFATEERFCDSDEKESVSYLESCQPIRFSNREEYLRMKEESKTYLTDMLAKSEQMVRKP